MICNKCGSQIADGSSSCPSCGAPQGGGTQVPFGGMTNAATNKAAFFQQQSASVNFIGLIAAVVGIICVFPAKVVATISFWGMSESVGVSILTDVHYGVFMILLFAITGALMFLKKSHAALIPAAINTIFCIIKIIQEYSAASDIDYGKVSLNVFYWLVLVAAIVTVAAVFIAPKAKN